jgi:hypothetical protein
VIHEHEYIESFKKKVQSHTMEIIKDDGVYRHIRFRNPEYFAYHFDLITWPGHLCITGDMGSLTFCRLYDMFDFFDYSDSSGFKINPSYWFEKLTADVRYSQFSEEEFWRTAKELWQHAYEEDFDGLKESRKDLDAAISEFQQVKSFCGSEIEEEHERYLDALVAISDCASEYADCYAGAKKANDVWAELKSYLKYKEGENDLRGWIMDFRSEADPEFHAFRDFYEYDCTEYVPQCLYRLCAISWGVQQYKKEMVKAEAVAV